MLLGGMPRALPECLLFGRVVTLMPNLPAHIPARMLNEYAYCPRLAYLEWSQGEWADNVETLEGAYAHRRVDRAQGARAKVHDRSVDLASDQLGVVAKLDLIESDGARVRPVDYKRGKRPPVREGAYEPERVQLCLQGLLLREHGYECNEGVLYFVASKEKVRVRFTQPLVERTLTLVEEMRSRFSRAQLPPPLEDSPKCPRCSLVRICLPEETNFFRLGGTVRPLVVQDPATFPLVVQEPRAKVRLSGEQLLIEVAGEVQARAKLVMTSQLVLSSGAEVTAAAIRACCQRGIPIVHTSGTGWLYGLTTPQVHKNVELRALQFATARDGDVALSLSRSLVAAKIRNGRVILRRNGTPSEDAKRRLQELARAAERADDTEQLLGIEGTAARLYYAAFATTIKKNAALAKHFDATGRARRPPPDPLNALLSLAYSALTRDWVTTAWSIGFDPLMGYYHQPRYGKPALALDLMEPFRPIVADSVVMNVLNNGEIGPGDFFEREGGVFLTPDGRRSFYKAYERRVAQEIRHPIFGYKCSYRRLFEIQGRLLARFLFGEIPVFPALTVR